MVIGYRRVSKSDGSQVMDLQTDALIAAGVEPANIYEDQASGKKDDRAGLQACLKALRPGDVLVVWKIDRLGRTVLQLVQIAADLNKRGIGLKIIAGAGASIDTTTPAGRMMFNMFATVAEFERELIVERTNAGLQSARARGKVGGRKFALTPAKLRMAQACMRDRTTKVAELCDDLGISRQTLGRLMAPDGTLRPAGEKLLAGK